MNLGRCLINTAGTDAEIYDEFISLHPEFREFAKKFVLPKGFNIPMLVRYLVFCYDKNSSIAIEHKARWMVKKREAAGRAKFPSEIRDNTLKFTAESEEIIFNKNPQFSDIIVRYLALQFENDFELYMVYKEMLHNVMKELQKYNFDKPSDLSKAKQNAQEIQEDIDKLEFKLFSGEEERTLKTMLYAEAYKSSLELRPEHVVTRNENGESVVDVEPYGKGYKPKKLKYVDDH